MDPSTFLGGRTHHALSKVCVRYVQGSFLRYLVANPDFALRRAWHDSRSTKEDHRYPRILVVLEEGGRTLKVEVNVLANPLKHPMEVSRKVGPDAPVTRHSCRSEEHHCWRLKILVG